MGRDNERATRSKQVRGRAEALARRLRGRYTREHERGSIADCPGVLAAIDAVAEYGAAITFTRTSNGNAWSVCVIDNGAFQREYPKDVEEMAALMQAICETYGEEES